MRIVPRVIVAVLYATGAAVADVSAEVSPDPAVEATADACRLDFRKDGDGVVLVAERRGGVYLDVHAEGVHVAGDVDLIFGFNLYNTLAAAEPGAGVTRVALDAEMLQGLANTGWLSATLPSGFETAIDDRDADRLVGELMACARAPTTARWTPGRLPPGSDWVERIFPVAATLAWSLEIGPGYLLCTLTAPLPGGGRVSLVDRPAPAPTTLVIERADIVPTFDPVRFLFPGGWSTEAWGNVDTGLASIDLQPESEARTGIDIFANVTVVMGDVSVSFAASFGEALLAERDRCRERMRRWE